MLSCWSYRVRLQACQCFYYFSHFYVLHFYFKRLYIYYNAYKHIHRRTEYAQGVFISAMTSLTALSVSPQCTARHKVRRGRLVDRPILSVALELPIISDRIKA